MEFFRRVVFKKKSEFTRTALPHFLKSTGLASEAENQNRRDGLSDSYRLCGGRPETGSDGKGVKLFLTVSSSTQIVTLYKM